jgi:hypothetical protein
MVLLITCASAIDIQGVVTNPMAPFTDFAPTFEALWKSEAVTCKTSGKTVQGLPRPSMAIIDVGFFHQLCRITSDKKHSSFLMTLPHPCVQPPEISAPLLIIWWRAPTERFASWDPMSSVVWAIFTPRSKLAWLLERTPSKLIIK